MLSVGAVGRIGQGRRLGSSGGGGGPVNEAPVITAPPEILGTPALGETLTADRGPVTGTPTPSPTGQWYRNGAPRLGQTADTYIPVSGDQGADMTFEQIETNVAGEAREMSAPVYIPYAPIDPATLSPTAWFRPNEPEMAYTSDNGNTPVTAAGQTVALLLGFDTQKGRGPEILSNPGGPFTSTTGWTARNSATLSVVSGRMRVAGGASFSYAEGVLAGVTVGARYEAVAHSVFVAGSDNNLSIASSNLAGANAFLQGGPLGTSGLRKTVFTPTSTTFYLRMISNDNGDTYDYDYISFREITGRHAAQTVAGNRPTWRQGGNGVFYLESVSSDSLNWTAPAGTYTVAYVIPDGTVTVLTGQSLSGATDIMLAPQIVEYIAIPGSITTEQTGGIIAYLEGVANP